MSPDLDGVQGGRGELPDLRTDSATFPDYVPVDGSPAFGAFVRSLRTLQDLICATNPDDAGWRAARTHLDRATEALTPHQVPEGIAPGGRALNLPGFGNPLLPAWRIDAVNGQEVTFRGEFSRFFMGANDIVLGGALPLLFDWCFAIAVTAARRPLSRTASLDVTFRRPAFADTALSVRTRVEESAGRKTTLAAVMEDQSGETLAEARTLMIALRADQG